MMGDKRVSTTPAQGGPRAPAGPRQPASHRIASHARERSASAEMKSARHRHCDVQRLLEVVRCQRVVHHLQRARAVVCEGGRRDEQRARAADHFGVARGQQEGHARRVAARQLRLGVSAPAQRSPAIAQRERGRASQLGCGHPRTSVTGHASSPNRRPVQWRVPAPTARARGCSFRRVLSRTRAHRRPTLPSPMSVSQYSRKLPIFRCSSAASSSCSAFLLRPTPVAL